MRRVRTLFAATAVLTVTLWASVSGAYHTGKTFGQRAIEGGGGGIFYVGMPLERGWDCTMCHLDAPGRMKIEVDVDPPGLFETFRYEVGESYAFVVNMVWEDGATELGLSSGRSNFNALVVGVADAEGIFAGSLQGGDFVSGSGNGTIASEGLSGGQTRYTFRWFAPERAGRGTVKLFFGAVDGNGADSDPDLTRSDPFGDDVFLAQVTLQEGTGATATTTRPALGTEERAPAGQQLRPIKRLSRGVRATSQPIYFRKARASRIALSRPAGTLPPRHAGFAATLCLWALLGLRRRQSLHTREKHED